MTKIATKSATKNTVKVATKAYTKRQLQAKAKRQARMDKMAEIANIAFKPQDIEYAVTSEGDRVRVTGAKSFDEARDFCMGRRGYDLSEIREELGDNWVKYMVTAGYAVEHMKGTGIFILTTKAQKTYGLPSHINGGMPANYAKVA